MSQNKTDVEIPKVVSKEEQKNEKIKKYNTDNTRRIKEEGIKRCKSGTINHLLFGDIPSTQSLNIKYGRVGEKMSKEMIRLTPNLELLECGCRDIGDGIMKDFDLMWSNKDTIFYRELKGNLELDTEKLPAMITKINIDIFPYLKKEYTDKNIDIGILYWSVYERNDLGKHCAQHIKKCENANIKVEHMSDFMKLINFEWNKKDFNDHFISLGKILISN